MVTDGRRAAVTTGAASVTSLWPASTPPSVPAGLPLSAPPASSCSLAATLVDGWRAVGTDADAGVFAWPAVVAAPLGLTLGCPAAVGAAGDEGSGRSTMVMDGTRCSGAAQSGATSCTAAGASRATGGPDGQRAWPGRACGSRGTTTDDASCVELLLCAGTGIVSVDSLGLRCSWGSLVAVGVGCAAVLPLLPAGTSAAAAAAGEDGTSTTVAVGRSGAGGRGTTTTAAACS